MATSKESTNVILSEHDARQACQADDIDPDLMIAGRPAWKSYTKAKAAAPEPDLLSREEIDAFKSNEQHAKQRQAADALCDADAEKLETLVGKKIQTRQGVYKITRVNAGWDGRVHAHGKKITKEGKLGTQSWDIGFISPEHFAK